MILIAVLSLLMMYCSQPAQNSETQEVEPVTQKSEVKKVRDDMSELSIFMRDMYDLHDVWKNELANEGRIITQPLAFNHLHTAVATNPDDLDETYTALANQYIQNTEALAKNPENAKELFNISVGNCVSCHEIYCQGPIAKIKKLYIAQ